ncbi:MAG TPA: pyridoxamine 5'-phosphate oxidase family protein [Patescibacteria group bacterium]
MEQFEIKHHVREVLNQEILISLATTDMRHQPWASVVHFTANDDFTIYWLSDPKARHSENVETTKRAAGTVTLPLDADGKSIALQLEGTARRIVGDEVNMVRDLTERRRGKPINPALLETRTFYALVPDRIYLLHEPLLGYERVELLLSA